jgi:para-nitrobenzyl esterase
MKPIILPLTILALAAAVAQPSAASADPVAATTSGSVKGFDTDSYRAFLGIPYAAPPTGKLRWMAPQPATPWSGTRDATKPSADCAQAVTPGLANPAAQYDEDCLDLNVVTPLEPGDKPLPVMVWIHGGGFQNGAGIDYDPARLATVGKVMVVTINYRLGAFGFFGLPGLKHSGDVGLLDQQAAMKWVRANAAAFGGDPHNVTMFGESAGAMSGCAQLTAPGARGLFDKAILQSGSCLQSWRKGLYYPTVGRFDQFVPLSVVDKLGLETAAKLGCKGRDVLGCMQKIPAADLIKAWPYSQTAYGGPDLPLAPGKAMAKGAAIAVPMIWGGTRDEWRGSAAAYSKTTPFTAKVYEGLLADEFGDKAKAVEAAYPAADYGGPAYAWGAISTDTAWSCPTQTNIQQASRHATVYRYEFADRDAPNPAGPAPTDFKLGAAHATELAYLFDLGGKHFALRPDQEALGHTMILYWTNFAATGDPNGGGTPAWKPISGPGDPTGLALAPGENGIRTVDLSAEHHCDLWTAIP